MLLYGRPVIDNLFFFRRQVFEWHVRPYTHRPAYVYHQCPHQRIPGSYRTLVDGEGWVGDEGRFVHRHHGTYSSAFLAGSSSVEGQIFGRRGIEMCATFGAYDFSSRGNVECRWAIMPVRATVAGQAGEHQAKAVEQLRPCAERASDTRYAGTLAQGDGGRHIENVVYLRFGRLGDASAGIGRQRFQVASRAFSIHHSKGQ